MTTTHRKVQFRAASEDQGRRLDQVIAAHVPELSRRKARVVLDIGGVFVDRTRVKVASRTVREGQLIEVHLGGALERARKAVGARARADDARALPPYKVVFEDDDIVVVDKPAGLLTAPTPESDRQNLADLLRREGPRPHLFVVHRMDLGTSGLLVFAGTDLANRVLSARFRDHDIRREYLAVVAGLVTWDARSVAAPVQGRPALTHFTVEERIEGSQGSQDHDLATAATVLRARLETGRTHQIRIHCAHLGHPVLGDRQYGRRAAQAMDPPRMALHACVLGIEHPRTGEPLTFESPLPEDLATWLAGLRQPNPAPGAAPAGAHASGPPSNPGENQ